MAQQSYTEDLELRFVKAQRQPEQYETLKSAAHALVTHWLSTDDERYSLRLHYFERARKRRGGILANTPNGGDYYRYGLTADERITVEECYEDSQLVHETFWQYQPDTTETIRFVKNRPVLICKLDYAHELPTLYRHYGYQGSTLRTRETYTHQDERLTVIKAEGTEYGRWTMEYHCIYTLQKELERIDVVTAFPAGYMNTVYRAPIAQKASTPDARRKAYVNLIVEAVRKKHIQKMVCGLMLNYQDMDFFPPLVIPFYEEQRQEMLVQKPSNMELIWAFVPEREDYISIDTTDDWWDELIAETDDDYDERALLADIARDLMAVDWTGKLNITDDFVAYSLDYEADSVQERLTASVPQEKLDLLRARGLW